MKRIPCRLTCGILLVGTSLAMQLGCGVLGPIARRPPAAEHSVQESFIDGYDDYTGVIHVHTRYSHDAHGRFEDVVRIADRLRLDYVIITEHNTLQPLHEGKEGKYGTVLVLVGVEISTPAGHYIALDVYQDIDRDQPTQDIINEVNRQGGFGFIAHPYFKRQPWTDWDIQGFHGIEGYNTVHDAFDENLLRVILWAVVIPPDMLYLSLLDRPYDPLAKWDALLRKGGRLVAIGSSDAHEYGIVGVTFAPYELLFKLVRTHVLLPEGQALTKERVYTALRAGHTYFSIDLVTDTRGFAFKAMTDTQQVGIMGDEVAYSKDLYLETNLPDEAQLALFQDGRRIATYSGRHWRVPVREVGIYRIEATKHGRPWIFSNPIYVRSGASGADAGADLP